MKINRVTFTGADDNTSYQDLIKIQKIYPQVEWGILFSKSRRGTEKYPSDGWIHYLPKELQLSAHFCGKYSIDVIENENFTELDLLGKFKRVQLNYNFSNSVDYNFAPLYNKIQNSWLDCILQYNKDNSATVDKELGIWEGSGLHILYDSSGGRGIPIKEIREPFKNYYTGYSGGINSDNIERIVQLIENHPDNSEIWIDMEAGVRTDGKFDLSKVEKVLEIVTKQAVLDGK